MRRMTLWPTRTFAFLKNNPQAGKTRCAVVGADCSAATVGLDATEGVEPADAAIILGTHGA